MRGQSRPGRRGEEKMGKERCRGTKHRKEGKEEWEEKLGR